MKHKCLTSFFLALCAAFLIPSESSAMGRGGNGYTLLVVPSTYAAVQVTRDVVDRHPAIMVSYDVKSSPENPFLHVWTNGQWTRVNSETYASGAFLRAKPSRTVVVGESNAIVEALITQASAWSPQVLNQESHATAPLLNYYGNLLGFSVSEYKWFAKRYELDVSDQNAERRDRSWYDGAYVDERPRKRMETEIIEEEKQGPSEGSSSLLPPVSAVRPATPLTPAIPVPAPPLEEMAPVAPEAEVITPPEPVAPRMEPAPPLNEEKMPAFGGWQEKAVTGGAPQK